MYGTAMACGGNQDTKSKGAPQAQISGMPPLFFSVASASPEFQRAWKAVDQLEPLDTPPKWLSRPGFDDWAQDTYEAWLLSRTEAIALVRYAAQKARAHPIEGPIAYAMVGFVSLDTYQSIREVEFPAAVEKNEDYESIVESFEAPLTMLNDLGYRSYQTCAEVQGPTELAAWLAHCRKQGSAVALPAGPSEDVQKQIDEIEQETQLDAAERAVKQEGEFTPPPKEQNSEKDSAESKP